MTQEERDTVINKCLDACRQVRDDERPASWSKEFGEGYSMGADCCISMIINTLHPKTIL